MKLKELTTESRNRDTENLDTMTALELVTAMNREDAVVPRAIERVLPEIAKAVDLIAERLAKGGRLIYVGSGTSGRIGALDASECPPTFNTNPEMVQFLIAGGESALTRSSEGSEDSEEMGRSDIAMRDLGDCDVVVGLAASGRTPYTIGALQYAGSKGSATIAVACNHDSALGKAANIQIEVEEPQPGCSTPVAGKRRYECSCRTGDVESECEQERVVGTAAQGEGQCTQGD